MSRIFPAYARLLTSDKDLSYCQQAADFAALLFRCKHVLQLNELSDDELIRELNSCNQLPLDSDIRSLASNWLPYRYNALSQSLHWCLPAEQSGDPFHDQYIERCRQKIPVNQLLQPKTSLASLEAWQPVNRQQPAAFIFHLSRCGSTLISGCLSEIDNTVVLSESALLTEFLLDKSLTSAQQKTLLPKLIHLQGNNIRADAKIIIKWNAWDIFNWPLIYSLYPSVPTIFVIRNPVEILASHQRLPGRHMSGDPALSNFHPVFSQASKSKTLLDFRISILKELMQAMLNNKRHSHVSFIDYTQITEKEIFSLADFCGLSSSPQEKLKIRGRMRCHSKDLQQPFQSDRIKKEQAFNFSEQRKIKQELSITYQQLITTTPGTHSAHTLHHAPNYFPI